MIKQKKQTFKKFLYIKKRMSSRKAIIFIGKRSGEVIIESLRATQPNSIAVYYSQESREEWEKIKNNEKSVFSIIKIDDEREIDFYNFLAAKNLFDSLFIEREGETKNEEIIIDITGASKEIFLGLIISISQKAFDDPNSLKNKRVIIAHTPYKRHRQVLPLSAYFLFLKNLRRGGKRKKASERILKEIADSKRPLSLSEITEKMKRKKQTIFITMKKLVNSGLVNSERKGREIFYFMDDYQKNLFKLIDVEKKVSA